MRWALVVRLLPGLDQDFDVLAIFVVDVEQGANEPFLDAGADVAGIEQALWCESFRKFETGIDEPEWDDEVQLRFAIL